MNYCYHVTFEDAYITFALRLIVLSFLIEPNL